MAIKLNDLANEVLSNPCFGFIGTLNESNQPVMTRVFGFKYDDSLTAFTVYTFKKDARRVAHHLSEVSKLAATISNALDFKTIQFKGTYRHHYEVSDEEMNYSRDCNSKQIEIMKMFNISKETFCNWKYEPSMAIVMDVDEIFDQTPKINTGNKIN